MDEAERSPSGTPEVSVIIPTFDRGALLGDAIGSVMAQTLAPLEILVVDDGSTDDTKAVCERFADTVRYIRQDNAGVGSARNRGAAAARGEWLAFLDSDDLWEPTKLEVQMAVLAAHGTQWSITDCTMVDLQDRPIRGVQGIRRAFPVFPELGVTPEAFFAEHLSRDEVRAAGARHVVFEGDAFVPLFHGNFASPSSSVIRREVFHEVGGFDERFAVAEDTELFHRLAAVAPVAIVLSPLFRWRTGHSVSLVSASVETSIRNALRSLDGATELREPLPDEARRAYAAGRRSLLARLAYWQLSVLDPAGARASLKQARGLADGLSVSWLFLWAASLLPKPVLRGAHAIKRLWRRGDRTPVRTIR